MDLTQPELHLLGGGSGGRKGRVFTIPPSAPFLDALARAVLDGNLPKAGGPPPGRAELAACTIYLPNRAACRALAAAFLRASPCGATLLPRILPLGRTDEDTLLLLQDEDDSADWPELPVPPAIGALDRRMALTQLILAWAAQLRKGAVAGEALSSFARTPAAAAELALELMRLMDEAETEEIDLSRLREVLPERFAAHEQLSLNFLSIVLEAWPAHLRELGVLNPVDRRNRIMKLEAQRLRQEAGEAPVIIAGSTGSIPATAALMNTVLDLPNGAIVLPGLDLELDEASWNAVADHPEHPQAGLHQLLAVFNVARAEVRTVHGAEPRDAARHRLKLVSEAIRPASTIGKWAEFTREADSDSIRESLTPVSLIAAPNEQEEAATIALILREALETPGKTATLVAPDKALARRVVAELARWGLSLDMGGELLRSTSAGTFFELIAETASTGSQLKLLALLKHPLTRLGLPEGAAQNAARVLEIAGMRQAWCGEGLDALAKSLAMAQRRKPRHVSLDRLTEGEWEVAADLLARLKSALRPLVRFSGGKRAPFNTIAAAHLEAAQALATDETRNFAAFSQGRDGESMGLFMTALVGDTPGPAIPLADYPALFRSLIGLEKTRLETAGHPRLQILGAMEARLTSADLVVVAGLNEGTWPQAADSGPWVNRSMRAALGLPPPERRTRLAGHDFWQMLSAPEVVLTRSVKSGGAPTVPSRWLMRVEALLQGLELSGALAPEKPWVEWSGARFAAESKPPAKAPAPRPPVNARPRRLSISDIQKLIANPYAIYAKHVLGLSALNPLEAGAGGAERGQIIHDMLHRFAERHPAELPEGISGELLAIFDECASLYGDQAQISAFWRPRLERFAAWFEETERDRRAQAWVFTEVPGTFSFQTSGGPFTLRGRADRIDLHPDGSLALYDYKSGSIPADGAVSDFKAPQLPLEALIASEGSFDGISSRTIAKLAYISAKGGDPAGEERALTKHAPEALAKAARVGLTELIERFDDGATPYMAMRRAAFPDSYRYDDYAHLARVAEWKGASEEG